VNELRKVDFPEPHRGRARALAARNPSVRNLLGPNPWTGLLAFVLAIAHTGAAAIAGHAPWWAAIAGAWIGGAFFAQALYAIEHECAHDLAARGRTANRVVALIANLPLVVPIAIAYGHYHRMHHRHQGDPRRDPDLPGPAETALARAGVLGKLAWHVTFPIWQTLRTMRMRSPSERGWLAANIAAQVLFGSALWLAFGPVSLLYLGASLYFTTALHPISARLFQEHHVVREGQETYSYYGPLNSVALNIGYHNEHHDFPGIAWHRLPALRKLAPEIYDRELTSHRSWTALFVRFFVDDRLGPLARIVRER
jgi:sphingolipid 4-desaturase/C4-monooxygenase